MRDAQLTGQRMAAEYLRQLLLKPGPYRDAWQGRVARPRDGVINQLAVAEVISAHLRQVAGRSRESGLLPYQLRELVSGGLFGGHLSTETLDLFVSAFGFSDEERNRMWRLLAGSSRIRVMSGARAMPIRSQEGVDAVLGPRRYHTLSMHDHIWVGEDGRIDRMHTIQVIEANAPGVDWIPFICDTNVLTLEVGRGCMELTGDMSSAGPDMFATKILLARTLDIGETFTLEYWVSYGFPGDPGDPSEREYRRGGMRKVDNLDIRVEFHPKKLPAQVWWAHWDGGDGPVLEREAASMDSQNSVHRYLRSIEKTVVGFYWEWE